MHSVTVPGAVDAWARLLEAHGSKGLDELLQPAIRCAEEGFLVTPRVAFDWHRDGERLLRSAAGRVFYLPDDRAPVVGQKVRLPALANHAQADRCATGPTPSTGATLAARMVAFLNGRGRGAQRRRLRRAPPASSCAPISTRYRGLEIHQCPPNGQGVITLLMLNILAGFELGGLDPTGAERLHLQAEATRLAYRDRDACLADPRQAEVPLGRLLDQRLRARAAAPDRSRARASRRCRRRSRSPHADTVYLTVVDRERNAVSLINSLFESFGSGLVCPETGVLFHNRGKCFSLDPAPSERARAGQAADAHDHPGRSRLRDGRPEIAVRRDGRALPAGRPDPGADRPRRFRPRPAGGARCAAQLRLRRRAAGRDRACRRRPPQALRRRGHEVVPSGKPLGGGQMIMIDHQRGVLIGGSDPRKDGLRARLLRRPQRGRPAPWRGRAAARKPAPTRAAAVRRLLTPVQELIRTESASGVVLIAAALLAFAWANSPWAPTTSPFSMPRSASASAPGSSRSR